MAIKCGRWFGYGTSAVLLAAFLVLFGCRWQMFEAIEVKASPTLRLPGGSIHRAMSDLEQFSELERQLSEAFDSGERIHTNPYTFRGRSTAVTVSADDFFDDARVNERIDIDDVEFDEVNLEAITVPAVATSLFLNDSEGTLIVSPSVIVGPVPGFVRGTIGEGTLSVRLGKVGDELPSGTYTLTVGVEGSGGASPQESIGPETDPGVLELALPLAGLEIEDAGEVSLTITLHWPDADVTEPHEVLVSASFEINEFSKLVLDVGANRLAALEIDPVAIDEELRRQVQSIKLDTDVSQISLSVRADLPAALELTLLSDELFGGGQTRTVEPDRPDLQVLVYDVNNEQAIEFEDPDDDLGVGIAELVVGVSATLNGYEEATGHLTLTDIEPVGTFSPSVTDASAQIDLAVAQVTLRSIDRLLDELDLELDEEDLEPLNDLPEWLRLVTVPVRLAVEGTVAFPAVVLTLTAFDGDDVVEELVFDPVDLDSPAEDDLAAIVNARPSRITFGLAPAVQGEGATSPVLEAGDVLELSVELSIVFDIQVVPDGADEVDLLAEFLGEEGTTMEDDAFGRTRAEDLDDLFDNLGSASLTVDFRENTTGLDELRYEITHDLDGQRWVVASGAAGSGRATIELSAGDLQRIRDTFPFTPSFALYLAERGGEESYRLNYDGILTANVVMELVTDVAYTFELFADGEPDDE